MTKTAKMGIGGVVLMALATVSTYFGAALTLYTECEDTEALVGTEWTESCPHDDHWRKSERDWSGRYLVCLCPPKP